VGKANLHLPQPIGSWNDGWVLHWFVFLCFWVNQNIVKHLRLARQANCKIWDNSLNPYRQG